VVVLDYTSTTAAIYWTTNTSSDSVVRYDTTTPPGEVESDSSDVTTHFIYLTGLTADTTYYFQVESTDISGTRIDDNGGSYYQFTTEAVTDYSITLDHACGVCGELIDSEDPDELPRCYEVIGVTAVVAAAGTYYVCWDSRAPWDEDDLEGQVGMFTASEPGSYTLAFRMPQAERGPHEVYLTTYTYDDPDTVDEDTYASFEVRPSATIDLDKGPVGTEVTVNCFGFDPLTPIRLKFKGTEVEQGTTDNDFGGWTVSYEIADTPGGESTFAIEVDEEDKGNWVCWISKYFTVTPEITAYPDTGTVGQTIEISGTGFAAEEEDIEVTFDGEVVQTNSPIVADDNGSWDATIRVPALHRDTYDIDASGMLTRARDVDEIKFILGAGIWTKPDSAPTGETITVNGGGFRTGETGIKVEFDGQVQESGITAREDGTWETSFDLPPSTNGDHTVSASGDITSTVTATLSTKAKIQDPSPDAGAQGDLISITGNGFNSNSKLTVKIAGIVAPGEDGEPLGVRSQPNGNIAVSFRVPKGSIAGKRTLEVSDEGGAADQIDDFTVNPPKTLSITPLPISPKDDTLRSKEVTFAWTASGNDSTYTYNLEVSDTEDGSSIISESNIKASNYPLTLESPGTYYWRVQIEDAYGNTGDWSDYAEFRVSPIQTWVWVVIGLVVLTVLMVVAYRGTKFRVTE
jgi:hypothetical protein